MNSHRSSDFRLRNPSLIEESKETSPLLPVRRASDGSLPIPPRAMRSYSAEMLFPGATNQNENEDINSGFESDTMLTTLQRKSSRFAGPRSLEMPSILNREGSSVDEFGQKNTRILSGNKVNPAHGFHAAAAANKAIRSSRVRKKIAARSKGGEFQARRRKRRLYFCCVASEIDVEKMADRFHEPNMGLKGHMYDEVLHLYMADTSSLSIPKEEVAWILNNPSLYHQPSSYEQENVRPYMGKLGIHTIVEATDQEGFSAGSLEEHSSSLPREVMRMKSSSRRPLTLEDSMQQADVLSPMHTPPIPRAASFDDGTHPHSARGELNADGINENLLLSSAVFWNYGGKEIFVFDFGAIVFWGYQDIEVQSILELTKDYIVKGKLSEIEFEAGEDDMAFVTSHESDTVTIANDVIILPEQTSVKSRLAVSFAIAQSSILSIFEARIEQKIEDYKYIPDELAKCGKVSLTPKELGNMIGEVFVIRHDVNLHSEILDIPDFFWKENSIEPLYRMTASYLEMEPRTEVLNKRLDLLRELLRLLQHQHETSHGITLEWIVIWLIVVSVVLELMLWVGETIGVAL